MGDKNCHHRPAQKKTMRRCYCGRADDAIAEGFGRGCELFLLNKCQWSMIDLLVALVGRIGDCRLSLCAWTGSSPEFGEVKYLVDAGSITSHRWVVYYPCSGINESRVKACVDAFGRENVIVAPMHAKMFTLRNDDFDIAVRSSANLNKNNRFEQFDVSDDAELCDYIDGFVDEMFDEFPHPEADGTLSASRRNKSKRKFDQMTGDGVSGKASVFDGLQRVTGVDDLGRHT